MRWTGYDGWPSDAKPFPFEVYVVQLLAIDEAAEFALSEHELPGVNGTSDRALDAETRDAVADPPSGAWDDAGFRPQGSPDPVDGEAVDSDDNRARDRIGLRP